MKTDVIKVHPEFPEREAITHCAKIIQQGGLVVFPTETVYGIAADANNPDAIKRLREVKRRSPEKSFTIMVPKKDTPFFYSFYRETKIFKLIDRYWPGPLTVIVPGMAAGTTVGMRMPAHLVALCLVQASNCAIAAPSANFEGSPAPTTCEEALKELDGLVDAALNAGPAVFGQASTIVSFLEDEPKVIREGTIISQEVEKIISRKTILMVCTGNSCRSVLAEYLLRDKLKGRQDVEIISAGTSVFVTAGASSGALRILSKRGIDAEHHRSQSVNKILLHKADLIFAMSRRHQEMIVSFAPEVAKRTYLLKEFARQAGNNPDISDPMGQEDAAYEECARTIDAALNKVVEILSK